MMTFNFESPSAVDSDMSAELESQLLPLINAIVQAAVAAGWNRDDVLLAFVELAWELYEKRRGDL
ncbi:hypothetical protein [Mesorhizobium sp. ES1-4]|uniref:hypothetical protein n=1 Tax=Mesorhizobium sp. ES1-4 TaxID=2876627 RepID=UPI001CCE1A13|nr:hypothetical protein [Mesorhizobium sp. ES1-4]MBZ9794879.1 hypothetical protein [Mesorhizobium sp. ES1-4]